MVCINLLLECWEHVMVFFILLRCFHASPELLAKRRDDDLPVDFKAQKKGKFKKRNLKKAQPPVDAPYVPPKLKRTMKSMQDKTIDIFEGMTIVELAKRTGESMATLQDILVNAGEKVGSEFDPLSIDVAELVVMVFPFLNCRNCMTLCFVA